MIVALRRWPALFLTAVILAAMGRPAVAASRPRLVILAINRLTLDNLIPCSLPNLGRLIREGAVGLMTTRSVGGLSPEKVYLSIGAGEPLTAGPEAGLVFDRDETYLGLSGREAYRLQTGLDPDPFHLVHLGLAGIARANRDAVLTGSYGRLGEALVDHGWRVAALGNADRNGAPGREAVAVIMDHAGRVALGHVGADTVLQDVRAPGGARTNYDVLRRDYDRLRNQADLILITLGDVERVHAAGASLAPAQAAGHLGTALRRIDAFLGYLLRMDRRPARILLLVASPPLPRLSLGERLTPCILWGDGVSAGLAYSESTRQAGVVTQFDVTATIAAQFGLGPERITVGRPIVSRPGAADSLPERYAVLVHSFQQREPVLQFYGYAIFLAAVFTYFLAARGPDAGRAAAYGRCLVTGLAMVPVFLLFLGLMPMVPVWLTLAAIVLFAGLAALAWHRLLPPGPVRPAMAGLLTAGIVLADVLFGSPLLRRSLLGYSPIFGARFYGMGNEYLGVVLGATILAGMSLSLMRPRGVRVYVGGLFILAALVIALPRLGANVGGAIAAVLGFGYTYCLMNGKRIHWREAAGLSAAVCALLLLLALCDLFLGARGHFSHLGQAVLRARHEGLQAVWSIIHSKLAMNFRLLSYTSWAWVLVGLLAAAPIAISYPPRWLRPFLPQTPPMKWGIKGMLFTALIGFLANDSGIVVAATILIYLGLALAYVPECDAGRSA